MNIKIENDNKEKYQSFTASASGKHHQFNQHADWNATGYGATEEEARANLRGSLLEIAQQIR